MGLGPEAPSHGLMALYRGIFEIRGCGGLGFRV